MFNWLGDDDFSILLGIWVCLFSVVGVYFIMDVSICLTVLSQCSIANSFYDAMRLIAGLTMLFWISWWGWVFYNYYYYED